MSKTVNSITEQSIIQEKMENGQQQGNPIYTLAQSETHNTIKISNKQAILLYGKGTEMSDSKAIKLRAKRKTITQVMSLNLIDVAKKKDHIENIKSYWNTFHCQSKIRTVEGKMYGKYCKNRYCTLCLSIRKATLINKYLPVIQTWEEPYFVTLTAKAVPKKSLNKRMKDMNRGFRKITSKYRKRAQRGKDIKLMGVRAIESNFNPVRKTYNPHLHIIVANKEMAEILKREWLVLCTKDFATSAAQDIRKITDKTKVLIEIIKYGSKIFTEPDVNNKSHQKGERDIYVAALENIFSAMKNIRIFDRFGFNSDQVNSVYKSTAHVINDCVEWEFDIKSTDWKNTENGNTLTGYQLPPEIRNLLENRINKDVE